MPNIMVKLTIYRVERLYCSAKCRYLKKLTCKGTLRQVFICLMPPPLLSFCLGWIAILYHLNLVRNGVLNSCKVWSPTGLNTS